MQLYLTVILTNSHETIMVPSEIIIVYQIKQSIENFIKYSDDVQDFIQSKIIAKIDLE